MKVALLLLGALGALLAVAFFVYYVGADRVQRASRRLPRRKG